MPCNDGIDDKYLVANRLFGCESREHLLDWFGGNGMVAERAGFHVAIYAVSAEHVVSGGVQCVFNYTKATIVDYLDPVTTLGTAFGPLDQFEEFVKLADGRSLRPTTKRDCNSIGW